MLAAHVCSTQRRVIPPLLTVGHRGALGVLSALTLSFICRMTPAHAGAGELTEEEQALLARAQEAFRAGNAKQAAQIARPLFDAHPDDYVVQDLRCQTAILQYLPREEIVAQCAGVKRLTPPDRKPPPQQGQLAPAPPASAAPPPPASASPPPPAQTEEEEPNEPPPVQPVLSASVEPPKPIVSGRDLTARRYTRLHWGVRVGAVFGHGTAGLALGARLEYGFDTGSVVLMPGLSVDGYFAQPNTYVEMATMKVVLPVGSLALFVEGGAGVGQVINPEQAAPAVMGGGGFAFNTGPSLTLGVEAGYEVLLGTGFSLILLGPIVAARF
jgi:hypothetical protein